MFLQAFPISEAVWFPSHLFGGGGQREDVWKW